MAPTPQRDDFDALVRAHYTNLVNFTARLVNSTEVAEEIVQDLFVAIWELGDKYDATRDPLPYLYRSARNRALSYLRHQAVVDRWRVAAVNDPTPLSTETPSDELQAGELAQALHEAIEALPERCRLIFTLSREQGMSYAEIARTLELSVNTVEVQMGRALRALRLRLLPYLSIGVFVASEIRSRLM